MLSKKEMGAAIKQRRKEKGIKQSDVSLSTGISRSYISDIENGRYRPSVDALSKLATCLDLDLNFLKMTEIQYKRGLGV